MIRIASSRISSLPIRGLTQHPHQRLVLHRLRPNVSFQSSIRSFTSSPSVQVHKKIKIQRGHKDVPEYPHGPARWYKKSNQGLFGGARVRFGNKVSKGKWVTKTRRKWKPNVRHQKLYSESLNQQLKLKVTARVLRTIDKLGGLDNYLLGDKSARIKELGMKGWQLRWRIMQTKAVKERFRTEREELGMTSEQIEESEQEARQLRRQFSKAVAPNREFIEKQKKFRRRQDVWKGQMALYQDILLKEYDALPEKSVPTIEVSQDEISDAEESGWRDLPEELTEEKSREIAERINAKVMALQ